MQPSSSKHSPALGWAISEQVGSYAPTSNFAHQAVDPCTPSCGAQACMVDGIALEKGSAGGDPRQHTKQPYVTGTSVIGLKYKDGVMVVADTLG